MTLAVKQWSQKTTAENSLATANINGGRWISGGDTSHETQRSCDTWDSEPMSPMFITKQTVRPATWNL